MIFKVFSATESQPSIDEIQEFLDEAEFEATIEVVEEDEDDETWTELLIYESNYEEPLRVVRQADEDTLAEEVEELVGILDDGKRTKESNAVIGVLENCTNGYSVELPEEYEEEDNMLLMASLVSQLIAARGDGIYSVDNEGFFDDAGELILELAPEE